MAATEPSSAVVIRIPVPPEIERLRRRWDRSAALEVPAHVTILFPFVPVSKLTLAVRADLAALAAAVEPFEITFRRVVRFPEVVYLAPEPSAPIASLTERLVMRYPEYPPYGGMFDTVVPHLTVTEAPADEAPLDQVAVEAQRSLPFTHRATGMELLIEGDGRWRRHWHIPFGIRR
jgi:2'-5' RNA ligase